MKNLVAKMTDHGCTWSDTRYVEYVDAGSPEANDAAARQRYDELFGEYVPSDCELCGSGWLSVELFNAKQSRKIYRRSLWRDEHPAVILLSSPPMQ